MKLVRFSQPDTYHISPFDQLNALQRELNRFLDLPLPAFSRPGELFGGWSPALDLYEDKENLYVRLEVAGFRKEDLDISLHDGALSITGERKVEDKTAAAEIHRSERFFGRFHRTISLPKPVKAEKVKANYKDGVLAVTLPKTEEARPKQIEVQVN